MTPTACWTIGPDETWHMDDMAIDCGSGAHVGFMVFAVVCIVAYPIGIPLFFLFLLYRNEKESNAVHPEENTDTETEMETKTKTKTKTKTSSAYDFLKKDYKPEFYYYECVTLCEKLLLTGLLVFIDQGSIFQCFAGQCIACAFLAMQLKFWPYADHTDNVLKVRRACTYSVSGFQWHV